MAEKHRETPSWARLNLIVTLETTAKVDEARAALKRLGVFVSVSALFEIAVLELLKRRDLADILRKHGARARRDRD
ncbi:MAG: hypothetical protein ACYCUI_07825 [Vulcanimicrobiaceae bacterium]